MKNIKNTPLFILLLSLILMINSLCIFADSNYTVSSDSVITKQGETVTVPLKLTGNKGIMGFRISVKYPDNQLVLKDVSSGSITKDGLFNSTITDYYSVKGNFDVLWSTTQNVKDDGTLFIMTFKVKETATDGEYNISVTYSQEDTFDENFNDVKLECSPVKIFVGDVATSKPAEESTKASESGEKNSSGGKVADDYLIASVEQILQSFDTNDISSLSDEQKQTVLDYVNNRIDSYGGGEKYNDFSDLENDYNNALVNEAAKKLNESTDNQVIIDKAQEILKEYSASTFSEIPAEKKQEAVSKMLQALADSGSDGSGFSKIPTFEQAAEALDKAVESAKADNESSAEASNAKTTGTNGKTSVGMTILLTAAAVFAAALIIAIIIFARKRRKGNE